MARQTAEHHSGVGGGRPEVGCTGQPVQAGFLQCAPQGVVEVVGAAAGADARIEGPATNIVDELPQIG
jgi:hypothetical protein